eukprot:294348_1
MHDYGLYPLFLCYYCLLLHFSQLVSAKKLPIPSYQLQIIRLSIQMNSYFILILIQFVAIAYLMWDRSHRTDSTGSFDEFTVHGLVASKQDNADVYNTCDQACKDRGHVGILEMWHDNAWVYSTECIKYHCLCEKVDQSGAFGEIITKYETCSDGVYIQNECDAYCKMKGCLSTMSQNAIKDSRLTCKCSSNPSTQKPHTCGLLTKW